MGGYKEKSLLVSACTSRDNTSGVCLADSVCNCKLSQGQGASSPRGSSERCKGQRKDGGHGRAKGLQLSAIPSHSWNSLKPRGETTFQERFLRNKGPGNHS